MPQIDISELLRSTKRGASDLVIDGEARDLTGREDVNADTDYLTEEPFVPGSIHSREDDASIDGSGDVKGFLRNIPYGPLQTLNPEKLDTKWKLFEQLSRTLPLNPYGLPEFVYRPDLIDSDMLIRSLSELRDTGVMASAATTMIPPVVRGSAGTQFSDLMDHLSAARLELSYHEGYPATPEGKPFWDQQVFETREAFDAFLFYLELGGTRKLTDLMAYELSDVKSWYHLYYWDFRVKAFDLYRIAHHQRQKMKRMLDTEDSHYRRAEKLFAQVSNVMDSNEFAEKLSTLDPEKLVKILDTTIKIQRLSAGLQSSNAEVTPQRATTMNVIMQQITEGVEVEQTIQNDVDILNQSPDMLEMAQELILKHQMGTGKL